ncbi:MAG TPA: aromatic-ring-hydroxylating dioxygenase subunit beta [Stellaceae bacterium]|nr:aromatic-ring-hydroxylating dioxygenase subunit beta [Stellaceae bacterium]
MTDRVTTMRPADDGLVSRIASLLHLEATLLDDRRWHDWLELYTEDCIFWAPAWASDETWTTDPQRQVSLIWADRRNLAARIFRVEGGDSYASMPLPLTVHLVTGIAVTSSAEDVVEVRANWLVHSFLRTSGAILRAGRYEYRLRQIGAELSILRKKILIHDDAITGAIDFYNI